MMKPNIVFHNHKRHYHILFSLTESPNQQLLSEKHDKKLESNTTYWTECFLYELKIVCKILIVHSQISKCTKPQWMK